VISPGQRNTLFFYKEQEGVAYGQSITTRTIY